MRFSLKELLGGRRRLPVTPLLAAGIGASLLALSLFFWGTYRLQRQDARSLSQKLRHLSQLVVQAQQAARQRQGELRRIFNEGTLPVVYGDLTQEREIPYFLRGLLSLSADLGVKIVGLRAKPALSKAEGPVGENKETPVRSFELRFRGYFKDLVNLVHVLERASKPMTMENFSISSEGEEGGELSMQLTLNVLEVGEGRDPESRVALEPAARLIHSPPVILSRDPFRFGASPSAAAGTREDGILRLSAILKTPAGPMAIIGQEVVGIGERVGDLVVLRISGSQVQLRGGGKTITLDWKTTEKEETGAHEN
ncbi:MAG: hypothetical protein HYY65_00900 [Candidatus Tectomicrobia bacterium]|uniref:Uncharacterized protein n=1 Tax=Tectimicrobiota bacterium TaxID=2528274 RepID=A0A932GM23_UNCTE|nr:hypothetical protein [Candidatus Tectomicrobia bacterium]